MNKVWTVEDIRQEIIKLGEMVNFDTSEIKVEVNNRLKTTFGRAWTPKENGFIKGTKIEIAGFHIDGHYKYEDVYDTIVHEFCHIYTDVMEQERCGHNEKWKANCRMFGISDQRCADIEITNVEYKYTITCSKCGNTWGKHRIAKDYKRRYVCGACSG